METSAISYRVADFLKRHAPFNSVDDVDLLALAGGGRVRFHEPNEYILWQGEPHRYQVFVLQQGTVSLWDESADGARLRDIRGAGDMLDLIEEEAFVATGGGRLEPVSKAAVFREFMAPLDLEEEIVTRDAEVALAFLVEQGMVEVAGDTITVPARFWSGGQPPAS